ncbi:uncharacterized protein ColSpa_02093 [Colletotrichum spaethianum]|uniref:Uncharacterized protein n=1 Tax=Colletotrichum spaethianum TaxID=700344 RepID=A0AA37L4W9_9PEZI|nr:uncharacterized protein ColSpa_02093 [Colletotrichum spaethianum]GKT41912.1 hypothetical protein ColSpa_02093 [Colletotrichum spaethianum]
MLFQEEKAQMSLLSRWAGVSVLSPITSPGLLVPTLDDEETVSGDTNMFLSAGKGSLVESPDE